MSRTNGVNVNLFVVHSQIVPLECLRRGIRGIKSTRPRASLSDSPGGVAKRPFYAHMRLTHESHGAVIINQQYTVGRNIKGKSDPITVEAEDALAAALKAKEQAPEAIITYVRKRNERGNKRHPHHAVGSHTG